MNNTAVAIPVRDEAKRVGSCLAALSRQTTPPQHVVLLLNNCSDGTADVARSLPQAPYRLHIVECTLEGPSASAGVARGLAMNYAASLVGDGVILTTDADGEVPNIWMEANLRAIHHGADAVCGRALIDPMEALLIPSHLHHDDAREVAYGRLLDKIASVIVPDSADPWPRHTEDSGASIAITASIFQKCGGLPRQPSGEDRALIRTLRSMDARVRHDPRICVVVSGRTEGRAEGGMADTIRRRITQQDEFVDDRIEPAWAAFYRMRAKRRFSALRRRPTETRLAQLARLLAVVPGIVVDAVAAPYLGQGWSQLEQASSLLSPQRVRFADLAREMAIAQSIYGQLANRNALAASFVRVMA